MAGGEVFAEGRRPRHRRHLHQPAGHRRTATYYFRICFLDPFQGTVLANYAFGNLRRRPPLTRLAMLGSDY